MKPVWLFFTLFIFLVTSTLAQENVSNKALEANFTVANLCLGDTTKFTNTSTDYDFVLWKFGDGYETYKTNPEHVFETTGTYDIELTAFAAGTSVTTTQAITINELPEVSLSLSGPATFYKGSSLTITANGTFVGAVWINLLNNQWSATGESVAVTESGQYQVIITDNNGCTNKADTLVTAVARPTEASEFKISMLNNILTPNGDAINDALKINDFDTYISPIEIYIYNIQGDMVYSNTTYENDWNGSSNGKLLPAGTYYYVVRSLGRDGGTGYIDIVR